MAITFVFGSNAGGGQPQEVNAAGEQGIYFQVHPSFEYLGHEIHGFELWTLDVGNYNHTLRDRKIFLLQTEEANIEYGTDRIGRETLVVNNSPQLRGFAIRNFSFKLNSVQDIKRNRIYDCLDLKIEPCQLSPTIPKGTQIETLRLEFNQEDQLRTAKEYLEREIRKGTREFMVRDFDEFNDVFTGGRFWTSKILTIQNPGQVVAVPADQPENPPNNNGGDTPDAPPPPPVVIEKEFTITELVNFAWGTALKLDNPQNLTEQIGTPRYQMVNITLKTYASLLEVGNKIKITGIQVAADRAWVRNGHLDILGNYNTIELLQKAQTSPNTPPPPVRESPLDTLLKAIENRDNQLMAIFKQVNNLTGDEFIERVINWGREDLLVNNDKSLNYAEIKKFLGIGSPSPNAPPSPGPQSPPPPSYPTPTQENSQKSEANIQDIKNSTSLANAQQKTQQEIKDLLDRYGVKVNELSATLWNNQTNWETYLNSLTTPEQVVALVQKMKVAIMQQSKQNQQANQQLTVPQLQNKIKQSVEALLKKYPQIKTEEISALKNWETELKKKKIAWGIKYFRKATAGSDYCGQPQNFFTH